MSLVSNFIGGISSSQFTGKSPVSHSFDLNDQTFSELLAKQMSVKQEENLNNFMNLMGMPAGFNIPDINVSEQLDNVKAAASIDIGSKNSDNTVTNSEMLTFFSSLFDDKPTLTDNSNKDLFNFERKVAASSYGKYARNVITDVAEFVEDTLKLK